ncbi:MAG: nucleotidyltransferase family protein [Endomicrobiia bacterium]
MKMLEILKKKLRKLKLYLKYLKDKYKVKSIGIFGSYLKGSQNKKSDFDILVDVYDPPDLFTFIEIENFISEKLKIKVDLVMKPSLKPYIGKIILT